MCIPDRSALLLLGKNTKKILIQVHMWACMKFFGFFFVFFCPAISVVWEIGKYKILVTQLCPTLCNPAVCSLPGSSVHGILQAIILEWVAIPFSRGSSQPRDWTQVSYIAGRFFTIWAISKCLSLGVSG